MERIFERIGAIEKYLEAIGLAIVVLDGLLDYLAELCETEPSPAMDTSALNQDLPEIIAELSAMAKGGGKAVT